MSNEWCDAERPVFCVEGMIGSGVGVYGYAGELAGYGE